MDDNPKVEIRPISQWTTLAVQYKRDGGRSVAEFLLYMMLSCIRVPAHEIPKIYAAWRDSE